MDGSREEEDGGKYGREDGSREGKLRKDVEQSERGQWGMKDGHAKGCEGAGAGACTVPFTFVDDDDLCTAGVPWVLAALSAVPFESLSFSLLVTAFCRGVCCEW